MSLVRVLEKKGSSSKARDQSGALRFFLVFSCANVNWTLPEDFKLLQKREKESRPSRVAMAVNCACELQGGPSQ